MTKELNEQTKIELDRRYRTTATVLFAQIFSAVALGLAAWFVAGRFEPFGATTGAASFSLENLTNPGASADGVTTLTTFLWITIIALAVAAFLLRRMIFAPAVLKDTATISGASGLLKSVQKKTVLLSTLGEIVAVLGFVIALASGNASDMIRAAVVALIIFFINFPRKSSWQKLAQAASR